MSKKQEAIEKLIQCSLNDEILIRYNLDSVLQQMKGYKETTEKTAKVFGISPSSTNLDVEVWINTITTIKLDLSSRFEKEIETARRVLADLTE